MATEDQIALIWFKRITLQIQDIIKKRNKLMFEDYMKLHAIKTEVYSIPDGELTKVFIVRQFELKYSDTQCGEIREILREMQLDTLLVK